MRALLILVIFSLVSCFNKSAKEVDESSTSEIAVENKEVETEVTVKTIKEEFKVEKLTEEEKLKLLMGAAENDRSASFQEVISFLDSYGETFAYLNFQDSKDKYTNKAIKMWEFIASNTEVEQKTIDSFSNFKDYVHALGIMDIDAVGLSHYRMKNGLVKNKFVLHKRLSDSQNLYWHAFGKNEYFKCFDFLPEQTVFAGGFRVNLEILMELNALYVKKFQPKADELKKAQEKYKLLESLNEVVTGEISAAIFWDYEKSAPAVESEKDNLKDLEEQFKNDIGLAIILELKEDADFKKVVAIDWQKYMKSFEMSDKDRGFIIIRKGNYVILADKKGKAFLDSNKLLKDKESFQQKLQFVQPNGTMFNYLDPVVTERLYDELKGAIPEGVFNEGFEILISKEDLKYHFLNVMENRPEGFYYSGVSNGGSYLFFWVNYVASIFHHLIFLDQINSVDQFSESIESVDLESISSVMNAGVKGISTLTSQAKTKIDAEQKKKKAKGSIEETKRDLSFLRYALDQYRRKNNAYYPSPDGAQGISKLVKARLLTKAEYLISSFDTERTKAVSSQFSESETSYLYLGSNLTKETAGYFYPLVISKPGLLKDGFLVILANNEIVHFKSGGKSYSSILATLNKKYRYNERQKDILRKKIKKFTD